MRNLILLSIFLLSGRFSFCQDQNAPLSMDSLFALKAKESIGKSFPEFKAVFDGRVLNNDSLKGKIVFINFWFAACPPCLTEIPYLNGLYAKLRSYKNFIFLSFSFDDIETAKLFKRKLNIRFSVAYADRQECYRLNQNNGFPTSIILDENGVIKYLFTGGTTDKREARKFVENKLHVDLFNELTRLIVDTF